MGHRVAVLPCRHDGVIFGDPWVTIGDVTQTESRPSVSHQ
jgi:hypothetical protein